MKTRRIALTVLTLCAVLFPITARGQTSSAPAQPLQVQPIESGLVVAPDAKFTQVNDKFATLAGVYGGWLTDRTLLVGAGAYWLANRERDFKMQYGGGLARWTIGGHRRVAASAGALVGVGNATLSRTYGDLFGGWVDAAGMGPARLTGHGRFGGGQAVAADTRLRVDDDFFIAEPHASAIWTITPWMRVDAGVGYRLIGASDLLEDELRGVSGSIGLQFGGR